MASLFLLTWMQPSWDENAVKSGFQALSIVSSFLLLCHCIRGMSALPLLFGRPDIARGIWRWLWMFMIALAAASLIPGWASWSMPALFVVYAFIFTYARLFSIENILIQNVLFYLALGQAAAWPWWGLLERDAVQFKAASIWAFFISLGLLMHSAGWEKLRCPVWRAGRGATEFLTQKHLIRPSCVWLAKLPKFLLVLVSWTVVVAELALLPALMFKPALFCVLLVLIGFSFSLFTVTDISFIGQNLFGQLCVLGYMAGLSSGGFSESSWFAGHVVLAISLGSTAFVVYFKTAADRYGVKRFQHFLSGIAMPIQVFTETHLKGLMLYRFRIYQNQSELKSLQVFTECGAPGDLQVLRPRYFQSSMYLVARIARKHYAGEVLAARDQSFLLDLLYAAIPPRMRDRELKIHLLLASSASESSNPLEWKCFAWTTCYLGKTGALELESI